ncbi:MAG TPA: hypothetical protein VNU49_03315 [Opitutaceae bacterium]|nr:hypothetical protein [Opitutaceae bacterium]
MVQPIILPADHAKFILVRPYRGQLPGGFRRELLLKKSNMDRNSLPAIFRENLCPADCGDFFRRAHESIDRVAQRRPEMPGDPRFQLACLAHPA